jgi:hypothetical protein
MPYFALYFGEEVMQRAAGNYTPDRETYPLIRAITDKGLDPASYVSYKEYHDLYKSRVKLPKPGKHYHAAYVAIMNAYETMIIMESREFLKQYDLFAAASESPLEPGKARLDREYIAGLGTDFASEDFAERLNGFSVRKKAYKNIEDVIDGYWGAGRLRRVRAGSGQL